MSDWYHDASDEELKRLGDAVKALKSYWRQMEGVSKTTFEGDITDIVALDYLDYEGIGYPGTDIEGASLVWGEVIRRNVGLKWVVTYRSDLMLSTPDDDWPKMVIWPFARIFELHQRDFPQFGKFQWALEQVIVDCLASSYPIDDQERLVTLLRADRMEYIPRIASIVRQLT